MMNLKLTVVHKIYLLTAINFPIWQISFNFTLKKNNKIENYFMYMDCNMLVYTFIINQMADLYHFRLDLFNGEKRKEKS